MKIIYKFMVIVMNVTCLFFYWIGVDRVADNGTVANFVLFILGAVYITLTSIVTLIELDWEG